MLKTSIFVIIFFCSCFVFDASSGSKSTDFVEIVTQNYNNKQKTNKCLVQQIKIELEASYLYQAYASYFQRADVNLPGIQKFFKDASAEEKQHAEKLIEYVNKRGGHAIFDEINLTETCDYDFKDDDDDCDNDDSKDGEDEFVPNMCICKFVWSKGDKYNKCPKRKDWKNALYAFEDVLAIERRVNKKLLALHGIAEGKEYEQGDVQLHKIAEGKKDEQGDVQLTHFLEHEYLDEQVQAINELGHFVTRLRSFKGDNYVLGEYLFDLNMDKKLNH